MRARLSLVWSEFSFSSERVSARALAIAPHPSCFPRAFLLSVAVAYLLFSLPAVSPDGPCFQVHIAYSGVDADGNPTGMAVVWTTAAGEAPPVVEYGLSKDE